MGYQRPDDGLNAIQRYHKKCDTITIRPPKTEGEKIRAAAEASGLSVTQYILKAVNAYMDSNR